MRVGILASFVRSEPPELRHFIFAAVESADTPSQFSKVKGSMGFPAASRNSAFTPPFGASALTKRYFPEKTSGRVRISPAPPLSEFRETKPSRLKNATPVAPFA